MRELRLTEVMWLTQVHKTKWAILVSHGYCTNYHEFSGLKQQKCILSQFWRPEVWSQGACRAMQALRKDPSLLLISVRWLLAILGVSWLIRCITPISFHLHRAFSPACLCLLPLYVYLCCSYKDTSHTEIRALSPLVWVYFNSHLGYICKDSIYT